MMADYDFELDAWPDFDPDADFPPTREDEAIAKTMLKVSALLVLSGLAVLAFVGWLVS